MLAGQPAEPYEGVRVREDGTKVLFSVTLSPVKDADGTIIGVSAFGRDVAREKQAQREIADWRAKAFKWMEELERFQRLSVAQEFDLQLKVLDLEQEVARLRNTATPDRPEPENEN